MKKYILLTILITLFLIIFSILFFGSRLFNPDITPESRLHETSFVLDGVELTLSTPFFPSRVAILPDSSDPVQVANFINREPDCGTVTLAAIPFGTRLGSETFPAAGPGMAEIYRDILKNFREEQGGIVQDSPKADFFGEDLIGIISIVEIFFDVHSPNPVRIAEWIFEGGNRIWILRFAQELPMTENQTNTTTLKDLASTWSGVKLTTPNLKVTSTTRNEGIPPEDLTPYPPESIQDDLPFPYWWDGECDANTYHEKAGAWAYPLGGTYRGVKACGPRPWFDDASEVLVRFYPGAWGVLEWQCVELSMRFLHLAYGIAPYQANGNQVVPNYNGDILVKINNGTPRKVPQPDDVISSGPETTYGHTAVVIESNVDSTGNGSITVLEQNSSETGIRPHQVVNWEVLSTYTVIGWLHDPSNDVYPVYFPFVP